MERRIWTSLLLLCSIYASELQAQTKPRFTKADDLQQFLSHNPNRKTPLILAHRGGPGPTDTENSLQTFDKIHKQVPEAILEMDVRMTKDSVLVLLHDDGLDRATTAKGMLKDKTWSELDTVCLRDLQGNRTGHRIPTFNEVLLWNDQRAVLAIDAKPGVDLQKVMQTIITSNSISSVFVICYSLADAQMLTGKYPNLWVAVGFNGEKDIDKVKNSGIPLQKLVALTPRQLQPAAFYDAIHQMGAISAIGTYGNGNLDEQPIEKAATEYKRYVKQGNDILTTDRPVEVISLFN